MQVNWVDNLTLSVATSCDDSIRDEFIDDVVISVEAHAVLIRDDLHQEGFKTTVFTDVSQQMFNIGIAFVKELGMCRCEVRHANHFSFRDVQFLGKYLRVSVNKEGLPTCLCVNRFNDCWGESLTDFSSILPKEFLHLGKRKISQTEFILDIEGRDRAIVIKLCDAFYTNDTKTMRTSRRGVRNINMSKRV